MVPPVPEGPQIAVAIVSWNTRDLLARALGSLEADAGEGLADVWVVDNASTDATAEVLRRHADHVRVIQSDTNRCQKSDTNRVIASFH